MTKAEVVSIIANATGLTKVETEAVVNGFISTIRDSLKEGKGIEIRGFGTFKVREKQPRIARNPRTGEKVNIPKKFVPVFKPSKDLKNIIDKEHKSK